MLVGQPPARSVPRRIWASNYRPSIPRVQNVRRQQPPPHNAGGHPPASLVIVDLDETLLRTDLLWEQLLWMARFRPLHAVWLFLRMLAPGNRAEVKRVLAEQSPEMPVDALPVREELVRVLRGWRSAGATVVLATATDQAIAERVAAHAGGFDLVLGSDGRTNLKGARKLRAIQERFPATPFVYAGDSSADRPLFDAAEASILVNVAHGVRSTLQRPPVLELRDREAPWRLMLRLMRPHHWVKNALVFLPLLAGHRITDVAALLASLGAALSFSLMASAIYGLNDLLDLDADRRHHRKRHRPLASGALSAPNALFLSVVLAAVSVGVAFAVSATWVLVAYAATNVAYSLHLKRKPVLDVMLLAGMYAMRVVAGGVATGIVLSSWLIAFSLFFFLALALAKRYTELQSVPDAGWASGRGYAATDRIVILAGGLSVSVAACLVLSLYISSPQVLALYDRPAWLWVSVPVALYWLLRLWLIAGRGALHDDPIVFALRDRVTYAAGIVALGAVLASAR